MDLFKEIDFSKQIQDNKDLRLFIIEATKKIQQQQSQTLRKIKKPELNDELLNQFIVTGIPVLKAENQEKFLNLFRVKILEAKKIGEKNGLLNIQVGKVNGIGNQTLYLTYKSVIEAKAAFKQLNNYKFTKDNTFECFTINEIRQFIDQGEKAQNKIHKTPQIALRSQKYNQNLDTQFKNQFVFRQHNNINVFWLDHIDKSCKSSLETQSLHTDYDINKIVMSPLGGYLAVCAPEGVHIYVGENLKYKCFLPQANAIDAKFSRNQKYLVSSNGNLAKNRQNLIIWALQQQIKLKSYKAYSNQSLQSFQFSQNSKYLAISHENQVGIYNITTVQRFKTELRLSEEERNSIKSVHIQKIAWLKDNVSLIVMCYELDYHPTSKPSTRIFIYNVETKQERKWRAWSEHAKNGEIIVSQKADWVAITLKKFLKKNHFATVIQIGNLLKKEQPLEISSLQIKEQVGNISWDSRNNRLSVIHEDQTTKKGINVRFLVSFYEIFNKNKDIEFFKLGQIKDNLQNRVVLSNNGCFFALYNISEESPEKGKFSLGLITKEIKQKGKRVYNFQFTKQNHIVNGMNFFQVDQSGRFILLGTEKGYQIWNFIGQMISKDIFQKNVYNAQWRPRLLNSLSENQEKLLIQNEKELQKKYKELDDKRTITLLSEKQKQKHRRKQSFLEFIQKKNEWYKGFIAKRASLLGFKQFDVRTEKYQIDEDFIDLQ